MDFFVPVLFFLFQFSVVKSTIFFVVEISPVVDYHSWVTIFCRKGKFKMYQYKDIRINLEMKIEPPIRQTHLPPAGPADYMKQGLSPLQVSSYGESEKVEKRSVVFGSARFQLRLPLSKPVFYYTHLHVVYWVCKTWRTICGPNCMCIQRVGKGGKSNYGITAESLTWHNVEGNNLYRSLGSSNGQVALRESGQREHRPSIRLRISWPQIYIYRP